MEKNSQPIILTNILISHNPIIPKKSLHYPTMEEGFEKQLSITFRCHILIEHKFNLTTVFCPSTYNISTPALQHSTVFFPRQVRCQWVQCLDEKDVVVGLAAMCKEVDVRKCKASININTFWASWITYQLDSTRFNKTVHVCITNLVSSRAPTRLINPNVHFFLFSFCGQWTWTLLSLVCMRHITMAQS